MNYKALAVALALAMAGYLGIDYVLRSKNKTAPQFAECADKRTETGRWIVFNKKDLFKKPGEVKSFAAIMGGKQIDGLNAAVYDHEPLLAQGVSSDWVVQKEYVHHIFQFSCSRCQAIPCPTTPGPTPTPTPTPIPNPTPSPGPGPIEADKSWGRARVHAIQGMQAVDTSGVKICDTDTGIDLSHPNRGNVIASVDFTGKGSAQDGAGHGTHTAGTLAGTGGVGVSKAGLLICKGLTDQGSGTSTALAQCLAWCGQQGAHISSNSWGSTQSDAMINQAIANLTQRGIAVAIANGNDSRGNLNWPAQLSISNPLVFGVAASDQSDRRASFSSYGPGTKFIAPGVGVISNWPGGGTRALDGTSMATPHVAALLAFCVAKKIPFQSCLKTDDLGLPQNEQGAGLPRADLTVN